MDLKAAFYTRYGPPDVLQVREVEKPTPKGDEVLIRTHAASVTMGDCELRGFTFPTWIRLPLRIVFGVRRPKRPVPGFYLSGEVESVGARVERFTKGDQVYGITGLGMGAHAEYTCVPEGEAIARKPVNMTHEEAAAVPLGLDAFHFLGKAKLQGGEKVLVNGVGGGIGTVAVRSELPVHPFLNGVRMTCCAATQLSWGLQVCRLMSGSIQKADQTHLQDICSSFTRKF